MSGLTIAAPYTGARNPEFPYADPTPRDRLLAPGVLALVVPNHSAVPMSSGASSGQVIPNVAGNLAADTIGNPTANVDFVLTVGDNATAQSTRLERTSRGAIHGIMSQTNNNTQYQGINIKPATSALTDYIRANASHQFYISMLMQVTRVALPGSGGAFPMLSQIYNNADAFDTLYRVLPTYQDGLYSATSVQRNNFYATKNPIGSTGVNLFCVELSAWSPVGSPSIGMMPAVWGDLETFQDNNPGASANIRNKGASFILYRWMLEDLTVSGRTFEQVSTMDRMLADREFAPGGLFYGDTYTSPAALP